MSNNLLNDLELVLIVRKGNAFFESVHHVGWVLNETKDWVLLVTEFYEDPDDLERCTIGGLHRIKKDEIKYRRPLDQAVNLDVGAHKQWLEFLNRPVNSPNLNNIVTPETTTANVLPFTFAELDEYISMTYAHNEEHCMDSMRKVAEWVTWKFTGKSNPLRKPLLTKEQEDVIISKLTRALRRSPIIEYPDPIPQPEPKLITEKQAEELSRVKGYVRDQAKKRVATDLLLGDMVRQQNKYERWWLNEIPVEIDGRKLNPKMYKITSVEYRVGLSGKGEVKIILQDEIAYIIEAKEGKPYPKKSQVKLLEDDK